MLNINTQKASHPPSTRHSRDSAFIEGKKYLTPTSIAYILLLDSYISTTDESETRRAVVSAYMNLFLTLKFWRGFSILCWSGPSVSEPQSPLRKPLSRIWRSAESWPRSLLFSSRVSAPTRAARAATPISGPGVSYVCRIVIQRQLPVFASVMLPLLTDVLSLLLMRPATPNY